ncbi:MAG: AbrB/MazE/SpoVT family DNA-binding domain-containing protein [Myxococcales bacterium]|nr:AbrB/MazE/SpoVT family DNA-binding domain-containing protein [Myxococcales bacterium]
MVKTLRQIGNSQGLILDKAILELLKIDMDTQLEVTTDGTRLIIEPIRTDARKARLKASHERVMKKFDGAFKRLAK